MHLVPVRLSPNVKVLGYYIQEKGGIAPFGTPWKNGMPVGFGAGYNKALGIVAPGKAIIKKGAIDPVGMVVHFAGIGTSVWKGMDITYTGNGHNRTQLIPDVITLCANPRESENKCSDTTS